MDRRFRFMLPLCLVGAVAAAIPFAAQLGAAASPASIPVLVLNQGTPLLFVGQEGTYHGRLVAAPAAIAKAGARIPAIWITEADLKIEEWWTITKDVGHLSARRPNGDLVGLVTTRS